MSRALRFGVLRLGIPVALASLLGASAARADLAYDPSWRDPPDSKRVPASIVLDMGVFEDRVSWLKRGHGDEPDEWMPPATAASRSLSPWFVAFWITRLKGRNRPENLRRATPDKAPQEFRDTTEVLLAFVPHPNQAGFLQEVSEGRALSMREHRPDLGVLWFALEPRVVFARADPTARVVTEYRLNGVHRDTVQAAVTERRYDAAGHLVTQPSFEWNERTKEWRPPGERSNPSGEPVGPLAHPRSTNDNGEMWPGWVSLTVSASGALVVFGLWLAGRNRRARQEKQALES